MVTQCCSGQFLVCLSSGAVLAGLLVAVEPCFSSSRELVWMAGEGDRNKNFGKRTTEVFFCSFSFLCNVHFGVFFFFHCVFIFVCLFQKPHFISLCLKKVILSHH